MQEHTTVSLKPQPMALSPRQVVDLSSLSLRHVMKAIATGELKSFKKGRRRIIFGSDLDAYLRGDVAPPMVTSATTSVVVDDADGPPPSNRPRRAHTDPVPTDA